MAGDLGLSRLGLQDLAKAVPPVRPDMACGALYDRFEADGDLALVAVVVDGRAIGLISRARFMQRFAERLAHARLGDRPVGELMHADPLIVEADETLAAVNARLVEAHPDALTDGFIVVRDGTYVGVGLAVDLLRRTVTEMETDARALDQARRAAETTSQAKSQFLANMSHELRTPLNAIIGFSEIIRDQTFGPVGSPQYRDYAHDIHASGQHVLDLINDILDLSKVEAGAIELYDEAIDVRDLIDSSLTMVRQTAEQRGVDLVVETAPDLPEITADARKMKQVLVNLLSNAVKFTPSGGKVRVQARGGAGETLRIAVADTGIGMTPDEIPVAMTPFRRVDGTESRGVPGTGLGLPLSKALMEAHGGSLELASARGEGTTVTVDLPPERVAWEASSRLDRAS